MKIGIYYAFLIRKTTSSVIQLQNGTLYTAVFFILDHSLSRKHLLSRKEFMFLKNIFYLPTKLN